MTVFDTTGSADEGAIDINGPWRVLFRFTVGDAYEAYIHDPH